MLTPENLEALYKVINAAKEWKQAKLVADKNPEAMLSSHITTDEAAKIMDDYFSKENAFWQAVDALDANTEHAAGTPAIVVKEPSVTPIAWEEDLYEEPPPIDSDDL